MKTFPGSVLVIDDNANKCINQNIDDVDATENTRRDLIFYKKLYRYLDDNGIPVIRIDYTDDIVRIESAIQNYKNVRLLILDLDLDGSGEVDEFDISLVKTILSTAIEEFGFFFLLITSNHVEKWESEIRDEILSENDGALDIITNLTSSIRKLGEEEITQFFDSQINNNYSLNLVFKFESALSIARDKAFSSFIEFNSDTWKGLIGRLKAESGTLANFELSNILINILRQYLINVNYEVGNPEKQGNEEIDEGVLKKIYRNFNYLGNEEGELQGQPIWTGNLYETTNKSLDRKYALIITPECDFAQSKTDKFKIVYGLGINTDTFGDYKIDSKEIPHYVAKAGKTSKQKWKSKSDLNKHSSPNSYLYLLPFASGNTICLDFRDTTSVTESTLNEWTLKLRVNDPMITNILDSYSNLFNRKGLLPFPISKLKLLD